MTEAERSLMLELLEMVLKQGTGELAEELGFALELLDTCQL